MKHLFCLLAILTFTAHSAASIPELRQNRINNYTSQYGWELWRNQWAKRGVAATASAGVGLLAYSVAKGYLFGKKAEQEQANKLVALYKALSEKQQKMLEGVAKLLHKNAHQNDAPVRGWFDTGWLNRKQFVAQFKRGTNYLAKEVLPGLIVTPVITQLATVATSRMISLYADRSVSWFVLNRTSLFTLCDELKKTAAFLDAESPIFQTVAMLPMLAAKGDELDPQMRTVLIELLQLQIVATSGTQATDGDIEQAKRLFAQQATQLMRQLEELIGFMHAKAQRAGSGQAVQIAQELYRSMNHYSTALNQKLAAMDGAQNGSDAQQGLLATVLMCIHHVQQVISTYRI